MRRIAVFLSANQGGTTRIIVPDLLDKVGSKVLFLFFIERLMTMLFPSKEEVKKLLTSYKTVPVFHETLIDSATPVRLFAGLREKYDNCFILESVDNTEQWGRYAPTLSHFTTAFLQSIPPLFSRTDRNSRADLSVISAMTR